MPKKILIMRHAKSSWENHSVRDFDRPLNERGNRDAPRMGRYLLEMGVVPDQIVSSPAKRAMSTIRLASMEMGFNADSIIWDEELYFRGGGAYLSAIRKMDAASQTVMAVGHYPMVDEVVSMLTGKMTNKHFGTATVACLESEIEEWQQAETGSCRLLWMIKPKELGQKE